MPSLTKKQFDKRVKQAAKRAAKKAMAKEAKPKRKKFARQNRRQFSQIPNTMSQIAKFEKKEQKELKAIAREGQNVFREYVPNRSFYERQSSAPLHKIYGEGVRDTFSYYLGEIATDGSTNAQSEVGAAPATYGLEGQVLRRKTPLGHRYDTAIEFGPFYTGGGLANASSYSPCWGNEFAAGTNAMLTTNVVWDRVKYYERICIRKVTIHYVPTCAKTTPGNLVLARSDDFAATDASTAHTFSTALGAQNKIVGQVSESMSFPLVSMYRPREAIDVIEPWYPLAVNKEVALVAAVNATAPVNTTIVYGQLWIDLTLDCYRRQWKEIQPDFPEDLGNRVKLLESKLSQICESPQDAKEVKQSVKVLNEPRMVRESTLVRPRSADKREKFVVVSTSTSSLSTQSAPNV